jgi:hypothetical protein
MLRTPNTYRGLTVVRRASYSKSAMAFKGLEKVHPCFHENNFLNVWETSRGTDFIEIKSRWYTNSLDRYSKYQLSQFKTIPPYRYHNGITSEWPEYHLKKLVLTNLTPKSKQASWRTRARAKLKFWSFITSLYSTVQYLSDEIRTLLFDVIFTFYIFSHVI